VRGEMKKVAWPPREEIFQSTVVVIIGLVVMVSLIFAFDWASIRIVDYIFG
jgi:preprotein translocase SecE subunit